MIKFKIYPYSSYTNNVEILIVNDREFIERVKKVSKQYPRLGPLCIKVLQQPELTRALFLGFGLLQENIGCILLREDYLYKGVVVHELLHAVKYYEYIIFNRNSITSSNEERVCRMMEECVYQYELTVETLKEK